MIIASSLGLSADDEIVLIQVAMLIAGITTLVQVYSFMGFGMGLPNAMGVAFAYMPILLTGRETYGIGAIFAT